MSGALAKQMYTYDTKRYSSSPTVRASAASYGRQLHEKLWGDTLRRNNLAARNRPLIGKMGTTHADGSYTSASGRHFKPGYHADRNRDYDRLRALGDRKGAERLGKKIHNTIRECSRLSHTSFLELGAGKAEMKMQKDVGVICVSTVAKDHVVALSDLPTKLSVAPDGLIGHV